MKHEITMKEVQEKKCSTFMKKDGNVRGCSCVEKSELKVGDEIVIDNYFTTIINDRYSWDDLYDLADGKPCGSQELKAKDNARNNLGWLIADDIGVDIETAECPEEAIENYLEEHEVWFDEDGSFI